METNANQENVNAVFKAGLKVARKDGDKLTQEKTATIALATIDKLFKDDGTALKLNPAQRELLKTMFFPQVSRRKSIIRATLLSVGCNLDLTTEELLSKLLNPAALEKELSETRVKAPVIDWSEMVEDDNSAATDDTNDDAGDGGGSQTEEQEDEEQTTQAAPVPPLKAAPKPVPARK